MSKPAPKPRLFKGNDKDNSIVGTDNADIIYGKGGNDTIDGRGGNDIIDGGPGVDNVQAGSGIDTVYLTSLAGGTGVQIIASPFPSQGDDVLWVADTGTDPANSTYEQIFNAEILYLTDLDDATSLSQSTLVTGLTIYAGGGSDRIVGTPTDDVIYGGDGDDVVIVFEGVYDGLNGAAGNDTIYGDAGNDWLRGGFGNDVLIGGSGSDVLFGQSDADTFLFQNLTDSLVSIPDEIRDFSSAEGDKIDVSALHEQNSILDLSFSTDTNQTTVSVDVDGDGSDGFAVVILGAEITTADVIW